MAEKKEYYETVTYCSDCGTAYAENKMHPHFFALQCAKEECKKIEFISQKIGGNAIIPAVENHFKILLGKRAIAPHKGKYSLPGGFTDYTDASVLDTVKRELQEELGYTAKKRAKISMLCNGTLDYEYKGRNYKTQDFTYLFPPLSEKMEGLVIDRNENSEVEFKDIREIRREELPFASNYRSIQIYFTELIGKLLKQGKIEIRNSRMKKDELIHPIPTNIVGLVKLFQ